MKKTNIQRIEYWYDVTSDPGRAVWCVSVCEDDGTEVRCLSTFDKRTDAEVCALRAANGRGIDAYYRDLMGHREMLQ